MEVHFERLALYEEVWSTPLTKLGEKYGLSDNGVRKVCKAMNIPLPKAGHWARIEAGQEVERSALPDEAERTTFTSRLPPVQPDYRTPEDDVWLKAQVALEDEPGRRIVYEAAPTHWHRALVPLRMQLLAGVKLHAAQVIERDQYLAARAKLKSPGPDWASLKFGHLAGGMLVDPRTSNCLRVSLQTYERALAVTNALLHASEPRGASVSVDIEGGRIYFRWESASIGFSIRERHERYGPGVRLVLAVDRGANFEIEDKGISKLEDRLDEFFPRLYPAVVRGWVAAREWQEKERTRKIQWAAYEELTRKHEVEAKLRAEESKRREALQAEAIIWQQAQQIRAYVAGVMSRADSQLVPELKAWESWALQVAEEKDPAPIRLAALRSSSANNGSGHGQEEN